MLDPKICDRCWKADLDVSGDLHGDCPWQCRLPADPGKILKLVEHTEDPPRGCHKMFEQAVYNTLLKKS